MQGELDLHDLESDLHRAWGRRLASWWIQYNDDYVEGRMQAPTFRIGSSGKTLGQWDGTRREIVLSARHILRDDWTFVLETLRHEMAHQYVQEVLQVDDESSHGKAFGEACSRLRCSANAEVPVKDLVCKGPDKTLRVIQKLLSLAESPNENEAQAAVQKARRLLVKYNIDVVELNRERDFEVRVLGEVKARHTSSELWIGSILNRFFFVESLWSQSYDAEKDRRGTVLHIYGTRQNLDMGAYVYDYLSGLLHPLWKDYKLSRGFSGNRERQRYFAGVMEGFFEKLTWQEKTLVTSEAMVWKGDPQLASFFRYHNPRVVTRYGGGVTRSETYEDGFAEGKNVSIRKPVKNNPGGKVKLLGSSLDT
ncbi:MAG: DUF2786 domain-containing protein [Candidatus Latescibacterota bacterium]|nr:DUF2786 domain-containing protein [Candidatus Latescibacterota bacterium]